MYPVITVICEPTVALDVCRFKAVNCWMRGHFMFNSLIQLLFLIWKAACNTSSISLIWNDRHQLFLTENIVPGTLSHLAWSSTKQRVISTLCLGVSFATAARRLCDGQSVTYNGHVSPGEKVWIRGEGRGERGWVWDCGGESLRPLAEAKRAGQSPRSCLSLAVSRNPPQLPKYSAHGHRCACFGAMPRNAA